MSEQKPPTSAFEQKQEPKKEDQPQTQPSISKNEDANEGSKVTLFLSKQLSDITLKLKDNNKNEKPIPAHKYVLATNSSVFHAMFCGPNKITSSELVIADITYETFEALLRYLYKYNFSTEGVQLDALAAAARKYKITKLETYCIDLLCNGNIPNTPWTLLQTGLDRKIEQLKERASEFIWSNPKEAFQLSDFFNAEEEALDLILRSNNLRLPEIEIFDKLLSWAQCQRKKKENNKKSLRIMMGDLLYIIRFPLMSFEEYNTRVVPIAVLSNDEISTLNSFFFNAVTQSVDKTSTEPFINRPRMNQS